MRARHKYLSYFWNSALDKTRIKENKIFQKAKDETSCLNVFSYILFSLAIVTVSAYGLRSVETTLAPTNNQIKNVPIFAKIAIAAETTRETQAIFQSHKQINIKPDQAFTFNLSFKNTGTLIWTKEKVYLKSLTTALKFRHSFWPDPYLPAQLQEKIVNPGETGTLKFALQAPKNLNLYSGDFVLVYDNQMIKGGNISVIMNVVEHPEDFDSKKQIAQNTPEQTTTAVAEVSSAPAQKINVCTLKLNIASLTNGIDNLTCASAFSLPAKGPGVRVGLFYTDKSTIIKNNKAWQVYDKNDTLLASVPANLEILFNYIEAKGEYTFDFINKTVRTNSNLYLKNFNDGIFTIVSLNDLAAWNKTINYNQFRGDLNFTFYQPTERLWVVNTLPMSDYLKGIKETSNPDPSEYQKAMTIAARTYSLYHVNKFEVEDSPFDLYPDERDQVYKGYVAETIMPNQANIVEETAGIVLTHSNSVIIAFYSARSGGQTLTSSKYPYLKSVETPYTKALNQWGHGVGIDQQDAKARAEKLNWTYDQILKYYYSGINIEKIY